MSLSEQDARRVLAEAEQAAAALAETILVEAQQAARDKVESIVAEAEEEAASRAQRIVAEAEEAARAHAESAAAEVQRDAQSRAEERLTSAEQQASSILEEAHEQSRAAQAPAAAVADQLMAEARQSIEAAEKKAHQILTEADEKAASIKALAEQEATNFIGGLKQKADQAAEARIAKAEEEGRRIIEESIKTARQEAEQITEEAEDGVFGEGLAYGQDDDLRAKFEVLLDLLVSSSFGSRERVRPSARRVEPPPADRPAAITPEPEEPADDGTDLFHGPVQLDFPPPLSSSRVLKIHKALAKMPNLRVLDLEGSSRGGIRIKVYVTGRVPLVDVLREMPEVEKASNGIRPTAPQDGGKSPGARRIVVATKS